jgi:hypothetical protein
MTHSILFCYQKKIILTLEYKTMKFFRYNPANDRRSINIIAVSFNFLLKQKTQHEIYTHKHTPWVFPSRKDSNYLEHKNLYRNPWCN